MQKKYTPHPFTTTYRVDFSSPILPSSLYFKGSILPPDSSSFSSFHSSSSSLSSSPSSSFMVPPPPSSILSPSSFHLTSHVSLPSSTTSILVKRIPSSFDSSRTDMSFSPSSLPPPSTSLILSQKNHFLKMLNYYFDDEKKELLVFYSLPNQLSFSKIVEDGLCTEGVLYFFQQIVSLLFSLQKKKGIRKEKKKKEQKGKEEKMKEKEYLKKRNKDEGWDFNPANIFLSNYQIKACFYMRGEWEEIIMSPESFYLSPADIDEEKEMIFISGLYFYYLIFAEIPFEKEINQFLGKERINKNEEVKWKKKESAEEGNYLEERVKRYSKENILKFYEGCLQDLIDKINQQIFLTFPKKQLIELLLKLLHPDPSQRYSKKNLEEDPVWKINENQKEKENDKFDNGEKIKFRKEKIERDSIIKFEIEENNGEKILKAEDEEKKKRREGSIIFDEKLLKIFENEDKKANKERQGKTIVTKQAIDVYESILSEIKFCEISLRIIAELDKHANNNNNSINLPLIYYTAKAAYDRLASLNNSLNKHIMNNANSDKNASNNITKNLFFKLEDNQNIKQKIESNLSKEKFIAKENILEKGIETDGQKNYYNSSKMNDQDLEEAEEREIGSSMSKVKAASLSILSQIEILPVLIQKISSLLKLLTFHLNSISKFLENNKKIDSKNFKAFEATFKQDHLEALKNFFKEQRDCPIRLIDDLLILGAWEELNQNNDETWMINEKEEEKTNKKEKMKNNEKKKYGKYEKKGRIKAKQKKKEEGNDTKEGEVKMQEEENEEKDDETDDEKEEQSKVRMVEFYEELRGRKSEEYEYLEENMNINIEKNEEDSMRDYRRREEELKMRVEFGIKKVLGEIFG